MGVLTLLILEIGLGVFDFIKLNSGQVAVLTLLILEIGLGVVKL